MEYFKSDDHPVRSWPLITRPRLPYRFEPVTIISTDPQPLVAANAAVRESTPNHEPRGRLYVGDMHPHLFALDPGDADSFLRFVSEFGIGHELRQWLFLRWRDISDLPKPWRDLIAEYEVSGQRHIHHRTLTKAWENHTTASAWSDDLLYLKGAYKDAKESDDPQSAAALVVDEGNAIDAFRLEIEFREGAIYERPTDLIARGWFELFDHLTKKQGLPKLCAYCAQDFLPTRTGQRYCPGRSCQQQDYDRRRRREPWQRDYERIRKQRERGTITPQQFEEWKRQNPRPTKRGEE